MNLPGVLRGYEPDAYPADINPRIAEEHVELLQQLSCRLVGSCVTRERTTVRSMVRDIEGHNPYSLQGSEVVGPLVLGGRLILGNAIGLWQQTEA
jgi:hypothetical protein